MQLIINNYSSKFWLTEDIKDCSKSINSEKLKENYNNSNKFNIIDGTINTRNKEINLSNNQK
jgi:hypothetical protein